MEVNVARGEFETLKVGIQVLKVESCPFATFTKFRENVQRDHATFTQSNEDELSNMHSPANRDMQPIIDAAKAEFDRTHKEINERATNATQQITSSQVRITAIKDEVGIIATATQTVSSSTPELVKQMAGITQLQQSLHQRMETMTRSIEEAQGNLHQTSEAGDMFEPKLDEVERIAKGAKGIGKGYRATHKNKERTLLDPKYMQIRQLGEKTCTSRGLCVKWRRNLDTCFDYVCPGVARFLDKLKSFKGEMSDE